MTYVSEQGINLNAKSFQLSLYVHRKISIVFIFGVFTSVILSCRTPEYIAVPKKGSISNPVRCDRPEGQRAYLQSLTDDKGRRVHFRYIDSVLGPEGNILDIFEIFLSAGQIAQDARNETSVIELWKKELFRGAYRIYMDMYQVGIQDAEPLPGLRFLKPASDEGRK